VHLRLTEHLLQVGQWRESSSYGRQTPLHNSLQHSSLSGNATTVARSLESAQMDGKGPALPLEPPTMSLGPSAVSVSHQPFKSLSRGVAGAADEAENRGAVTWHVLLETAVRAAMPAVPQPHRAAQL
jgi:hypothetical protein